MKTLFTFLLILCASISFGQDFKIGDRVEVYSGGTIYKGSIVEAKDGEFRVKYDGFDYGRYEWLRPGEMTLSKEKAVAKERIGLVNSHWKQVSVTTPNGETKSTGSYIGLSIYENGKMWDLTTTISYGSGVQILGKGTYKLNGNRLTLTRLDGTLYGDFLFSLDNNQLILARTNGKGMEVYTYSSKLQTK